MKTVLYTDLIRQKKNAGMQCWNAMLENAKRELRIDTEENGWECEFETVPECGRITLTDHINGHNDVTNWYTIEIPDNT